MRQKSNRASCPLIIAALLCIGGVFALLTPATVRAASVTATVFSDPVPGGCATAGTGNCSLREAVIFANSNPGTTIQLLAGTYTLTQGDPQAPVTSGNPPPPTDYLGTLRLLAPTTITGAGASNTTIDASGMTYHDTVIENIAMGSTISGVTITGGVPGNMLGVTVGGGIRNDANASLTVTNSQIVRNTSVGSQGGGGIANAGTMAVSNTTISNNSGAGTGSGQYSGGGVVNSGTLTLIASTVSGNTTGSGGGGGITNYAGGTLTVTNSTVSGNTARNIDTVVIGGVANAGTVIITGSTISGNIAGSRSGEITGGVGNTGIATITNSTVSGNGIDTSGGFSPHYLVTSGISNHGGPQGRLTLNSVTIANNSGTASTQALSNTNGTLTTTGTLLSNPVVNCASGYEATTTSGDYNLSSDASCTGLTQPHDRANADPKLGPLAGNGGPTQTHALLPGSAAIDAGGTSVGSCPATDQRGIVRPQGAACDIGAFEVQLIVAPAPAPHPTVALPSGQGTNTSGGNVPNPQPMRHADAPTPPTAPNPHPNTSGSVTDPAPVPAMATATPMPAPLAQPARH